VTRPANVGLLGFGYWGQNLARNLVSASSTRLVGIADSDERGRASAQDSFAGVKVWSGLDEMLDDGEIEAVVVATPARTHHEFSMRVVASGRHVLVEKPLAMAVEDAQAVVDSAEDRGAIVMVGHTFLYSAPVQRLRALLQDGELGNVQYLYSQRLNLGKIRRDCNALWNFGPHDVSIMLYLLQERPVEVSARGFAFIQQGVEDVFFASLSFESGVGANMHLSWIDPRKTRLMTVVGDQKMAIYDDVSPDQKIAIFDSGVQRTGERSFGEYASMGEFQWRTRNGDISVPYVPIVEPLLVEVEAFGRACLTGERPLTDGHHGIDVVKVLAAVDASSQLGGAPVAPAW
jgi:predicted dehydrogenase